MAIGVLQSRERFDWNKEAKPLLPGTKLISRVQTEVAIKNKTTCSSVNVTVVLPRLDSGVDLSRKSSRF